MTATLTADDRLRDVVVAGDPFPHFVRPGLLPAGAFARLVATLPPRELYTSLAAGGVAPLAAYDNRLTYELTPDSARALAEPWAPVAEWLTGPDLARTLLALFGIDEPAPRVRAHLNVDLPGSALTPHTDAPGKLVSCIWYLAPADPPPGLGTVLYRPRDPARSCAGGPHHDRDDFVAERVLPYEPNTMVGFAKSDRSFHGTLPVPDGVERVSVLVNVGRPRA